MHFLEVPGLAGDHSEHCAWDLGRFVSLDVTLKWKENSYYAVGRGCEMADGPTK